jgi:hypothetical protein
MIVWCVFDFVRIGIKIKLFFMGKSIMFEDVYRDHT